MAVRIRLFMRWEVKKFTKDTKKSKIRIAPTPFYNPRITFVKRKIRNFTMKRSAVRKNLAKCRLISDGGALRKPP